MPSLPRSLPRICVAFDTGEVKRVTQKIYLDVDAYAAAFLDSLRGGLTLLGPSCSQAIDFREGELCAFLPEDCADIARKKFHTDLVHSDETFNPTSALNSFLEYFRAQNSN